MAISDRASDFRAQPKDIWVLATISVVVALGFGVVIPILPVYASQFGVNQTLIGLLIASFAVTRFATSPLVPRIPLGERSTLALGVAIVAGSSALVGFAETYWQLLLFRSLGGTGSAMFTVSAMTLVIAKAPPQFRARAISMYQGGFMLGSIAGPALGGVLGAISLTAPFFFYAIMLVIAATVGLVMLSPGSVGRTTNGQAQPSRPFNEVLRDKRYQAALVANLAHGWTSLGLRASLTPIVITQILHKDPVWSGTAFAVTAVSQTICLIPVGRFVDQTGRRPALIIGGIITATSVMAIPLATNVWVVIAAMAVYGVGSAMLNTAPPASVADAAGPRSGQPLAVFSMMADLGQVVGPLVAGLVWDHANPVAAYGIGSAMLVLTILAAMRMPSTPPNRRNSGAPTAE